MNNYNKEDWCKLFNCTCNSMKNKSNKKCNLDKRNCKYLKEKPKSLFTMRCNNCGAEDDYYYEGIVKEKGITTMRLVCNNCKAYEIVERPFGSNDIQ